MLFEWSDHSHVTFTQWQSDEPSHANNHQEDCVLIQGKVTTISNLVEEYILFLVTNTLYLSSSEW